MNSTPFAALIQIFWLNPNLWLFQSVQFVHGGVQRSHDWMRKNACVWKIGRHASIIWWVITRCPKKMIKKLGAHEFSGQKKRWNLIPPKVVRNGRFFAVSALLFAAGFDTSGGQLRFTRCWGDRDGTSLLGHYHPNISGWFIESINMVVLGGFLKLGLPD